MANLPAVCSAIVNIMYIIGQQRDWVEKQARTPSARILSETAGCDRWRLRESQ